jgi:hypothetical protein
MMRRACAGLLLCAGQLVMADAARAEGVLPSALSESAELVEGLVAEAKRRHLADDPMWHRLLYYRSGLFGVSSEADGSGFFAAPSGKTDPEAELEATLRGLFDPGTPPAKGQHAFCRFPARRAWLDEQLHFDLTRLPQRACPEFDDFRERMQARSISVIFSSYYLNNPASAFGHTFLRLNKASDGAPGERQELLDYGINYAADADAGNAVAYALKGLTGLFHGSFTKVPYYFKVREYNDFESRDLWALELALDQREVDRAVAHIWELGSTYFDYFYLSENCSYHVLGILEVASPRISLMAHLGWPVIPAATVQALAANPGLVRKISYRPSTRSQFEQRVAALAGEEVDAVFRLGKDPSAPLPQHFTTERAVRVLDTALDLADFRYNKELLDADSPESAIKQRLLVRRAELLVPSEPLAVRVPALENPLLGHDTRRLDLGVGYFEPYGGYYTLGGRLALHDLSDPSAGFPETLAIEFLPTELRYYIERERPSLEEASFIAITSVSPLNRFDRSFSWNLRVGAARLHDDGCKECLVGRLELGAGFALSALAHGVTFYANLDNELSGLGPIHGGLGELPLRFGIGPKLGVRLRYTERLVSLLEGHLFALPFQEPKLTWDGSFITRWMYARNFGVAVQGQLFPSGASLQAASTFYF